MKRQHLLLLVFLIPLQMFSQHLKIVNPRCESKTDPLGVEQTQPRLSWELQSDQRGVLQTAYRILIADDKEILNKDQGNIWDSKKVRSNASVQIAYGGKPLRAAKNYYWKVQVWDNKNNVSAWTEAARWQMGLLTAADWKGAKWIGYEKLADSNIVLPGPSIKGVKKKKQANDILPMFRKEFSVNKPVENAVIFISGLGHFEMSLNGRKVGDHFLDPGWVDYSEEALYVPFDITDQLKNRQNAIGVMLGNGFYYISSARYRKLSVAYGYPKMICRIIIQYQDGSTENIVSDQSWKVAQSPITFSSIYGGEDYDATLEQKGWNDAGFDDSKWKPAMLVGGPAHLHNQVAEPVKTFETFSPDKITRAGRATWIYDVGQNAAAIPQISVSGKRGDTIRIIPAELVNDDGTANQKATGRPFYFTYILKGDSVETWQPRFTYYGFRYIQVEGAVPEGNENPGGLPIVTEIKSVTIRNAAERVGSFICSNDLFNRTDSLINWAIKSNMMSVFTDCPHRERLGWLEEAHLMGNSVQYNYDIAALCRKVANDMMLAQTPEGLIPEIAPEFTQFGEPFRDSPEWGSSSIILPWYVYKWYGDKRILERSYSMMQRYALYLEKKSDHHILTQGLSDWYDLGPDRPGFSQLTTKGITATAIYYYDLTILGKTAALLGKSKDAAGYEALAGKVKDAFNKKFFNRETKQYGTGSQASNAMAVYMKLVEPAYRDAVVENMIKDIRNHNNSLTAGDIGYRYLLKALDNAGRSDVIYDMNNRSDVPGYGYQLAKGATALTESWQALPSVSNNHFMLGHIMEWFYGGLAGIRQADHSAGYSNIEIRPEPVGDINFVNAEYHSVHGNISVEWKKGEDVFELKVIIPANTVATIFLPADAMSVITEGMRPVANRKDMRVKGFQKNKLLVDLGSGTYHFIINPRRG